MLTNLTSLPKRLSYRRTGVIEMMNKTRWFEYGEPTGDGRVEAVIRTAYQTGPNERPRDDDVREGTIGYEALEMMDTNDEVIEHTHDDDSVLLSGLSQETEDELLETFEESE